MYPPESALKAENKSEKIELIGQISENSSGSTLKCELGFWARSAPNPHEMLIHYANPLRGAG